MTAGVGYNGSRTHSPNENLRLNDFLNASRHLARIHMALRISNRALIVLDGTVNQ